MASTRLILVKTEEDKSLEFGHIDNDKEMLVSLKRGRDTEEVLYIDIKDIQAIIRHLEFELKQRS